MARGALILTLKAGSDRRQGELATVAALLALLFAGGLSPLPGPVRPPGSGHMPTEVDSRGRIVTPYGTPPDDVDAAIRKYFPRAVWTDAARVSYGESSWRNDAELNTLWRGNGQCGIRYWYSDEVGWATTEQSIGIFQINRCAHGGTEDFWKNADRNADYASQLYAAEGWIPWRVTARRLGLLTEE